MYPLEILPSTNFVMKLDMDALMLKYSRLTIVRQVEGVLDDFWEEVEGKEVKVLSTKVFSSSMYNLSMNLLGGLFLADKHLPFLPQGNEACGDWDGSDVNIDNFAGTNFYSETQPCFGICFYVNEVNGLFIPYRKQFKTQEGFNLYKDQVKVVANQLELEIEKLIVGTFINSKQPTEVYARTTVNHSPNRLNYWHTTLDTYTPNSQEYLNSSSELSNAEKKALKTLKNILVNKAFISQTAIDTISEEDYLKQNF